MAHPGTLAKLHGVCRSCAMWAGRRDGEGGLRGGVWRGCLREFAVPKRAHKCVNAQEVQSNNVDLCPFLLLYYHYCLIILHV